MMSGYFQAAGEINRPSSALRRVPCFVVAWSALIAHFALSTPACWQDIVARGSRLAAFLCYRKIVRTYLLVVSRQKTQIRSPGVRCCGLERSLPFRVAAVPLHAGCCGWRHPHVSEISFVFFTAVLIVEIPAAVVIVLLVVVSYILVGQHDTKQEKQRCLVVSRPLGKINRTSPALGCHIVA